MDIIGRGFDAHNYNLVDRIKIRLGRRAPSRRRRAFGLALTSCPPDHLVTKHWWKALMHSKQMGDVSRRVRHLVFEASSIRERNENNRVTRVVNLSCFCHPQGRVISEDKLSHNTGLGFPLVWLVAKCPCKCRDMPLCMESNAAFVESYQGRVRARVNSPFTTKKRRLLECHTLSVVPNYFIVSPTIYIYFQSTMFIGPPTLEGTHNLYKFKIKRMID